MNKLIAGIILSLYILWAHAEIQVQINPSPVTINEQFQLTLIQSNTQVGGVPDLTVLQKDFLILGTARQISYSVVNGHSSSDSQWVITLKPLKTGVLSIPAIKMGQEQSSPMTINVEASGTPQDDSDLDEQALMLKTSHQPAKPYINQEILYTVKLYNSKRLLDADYEAPQADNALIIPLGDAKRYQTIQNNTSYVVEEQTYAIFPQKSGQLNISSPTFTALVYDVNSERVKVHDKDTTITVQPIPKQYQSTAWLPAKKVTLTEQYEQTNQTLSQGSTLVRTITLEGVGIPAQLLPSLDFKNTESFNVYPEKGTDKNQVRQGELIGRTEFKITYLFNKPGKVVIPELRVTWFNTQTDQQEVAVLAPRSIDITPSGNPGNNSSSPTDSSPNSNNKESVNTLEWSSILSPKEMNFWAWGVALFFACAWIITLLYGQLKKGSRLGGKRAYKMALNKLQEACMQSNAKESRNALLKWASLYWPDVPILNLTDLMAIVRDPSLKKQIQLLSQVLYKKQEKGSWRGEELYKAVLALKPTKNNLNRSTSPLPPINP